MLRNAYQRGAYATLECKRANPLYKRWIFFDEHRSAPNGLLFFEVIKVGDRRPNPSTKPGDPQFITTANHQIITRPSDAVCPVFHSYLEVAINREKRAGHTQTVEEAFEQVMKGHTGLMAKIIGFDQEFLMSSVPVVVTTGEMFRADFSITNVPLKTGKIVPNDLRVTQIDFCAVSYHPNDNLSIKSEHIKATPTNIRDDLAYGQRRTVFVVRGNRIEYFLSWLNSKVEGLHL